MRRVLIGVLRCVFLGKKSWADSTFVSSDLLIHHSDQGSQYVSIRYSARLVQAGIVSSISSRENSYDNALTKSITCLYKEEIIHRRSAWKTGTALEFETLKWSWWFNPEPPAGANRINPISSSPRKLLPPSG